MVTETNWEGERDRGIELLEAGTLDEAVGVLTAVASRDSSGQVDALIGMAQYRLEQYDAAVESLERALEADASNDGWRRLQQMARSNRAAGIDTPVPDIYYFERDELLKEAKLDDGVLPTPLVLGTPPGGMERIRRTLGNLLGSVSSIALGAVTQVVGRVAGYRDAVWTNWYRRNFLLGILTLAYMRERLNKNNLKTTYPADALVGFHPSGAQPPQGVTHFRTADGTWNNLSDPKEGAAGTRFPRNVSVSAIKPETGDLLMSPNPRKVSLELLTRQGPMKEVPFLNLLAAAWINFENHDWIDHGEPLEHSLHEIPLAADDPARVQFRQTKMFVPKSQPDPTRMGDEERTPITFINEVTHWWDGSQIYGSDQETVDRLRSGVDGMLRLTDEHTLPIDKKGVEETGFRRNWWLGLTLFHTLFAREHNAICEHLKAAYPDWDDNRLFNVARLINAAVMAKIHSVEWTPAILPNRSLEAGLDANWYGLLTNLLRKEDEKRTVANINVSNPELGGVVANPINRHGQPYGLTEEFVEIYRLHSLLPETIKLTRLDGTNVSEIPFAETRQAGSVKITDAVAMPDLFYSFGNQLPGQLVLNNYPSFMQELSIPGNPVFDLGAVDVLRARERGVPRYNEFRRQLGLNPIRTFDDLTDKREDVDKLKAVYGDKPGDVERLDLLIGTLSEGLEQRPTGFGFGETMFQIFILNATRRLQADRFYTDAYNEDTYTPEGLRWVDDATLKSVLLRHYPELSKTGLANVKNAFEPWDTDETLDPERHPLRAFDSELKADPWRGSMFRD